LARAAGEPVGPVAAVLGEGDDSGGQPGGVYGVVAGLSVDRKLVVGLGRRDVDGGREPADLHPAADVAGNEDVIVGRGAADDDGVARAVAPAAGGGEVEVDRRHGGAGEVVDGELVGPAKGVEVDLFGAVGAHDDAGECKS